MTRAGPLDLRGLPAGGGATGDQGAVTGGRTYEDLLSRSVEMEIAPGLRIRVLDLAMLILLKEELGQEKDLAVLPVLRRILQERGQPRRISFFRG